MTTELVAELERRAARFAAVATVQQAISATISLNEAYREIYKAVASVVDAPCFALMIADPLFEKFNLTLQRIKLAFQTFALLLPTFFAGLTNFESARAQSPIGSKRGKYMNKARHSLAIVFNDPTNVCSRHQNSPATGQRGGVVARDGLPQLPAASVMPAGRRT